MELSSPLDMESADFSPSCRLTHLRPSARMPSLIISSPATAGVFAQDDAAFQPLGLRDHPDQG